MTTQPALTTTVHHELRMRRLTVEHIEQPTPRLVRITLGGTDMAGFVSAGSGDHVKVFFPPEGSTDAELPEIGPNGLKLLTGAPKPRARDYTPKHDRLADGKLVIDIVLHEHGVGSDWARRAAIGDTLGIAGPRGSHVLVEPIDGLVLFGDETALPAIANFLSAATPDQQVQAHVEVGDERDTQPIETAPGHSITWHHRNGVAPGRSNVLTVAAQNIDLPNGRILYWIASETATATSIRRCLLDRGIDQAAIESRGYWKLNTKDHQEPHQD